MEQFLEDLKEFTIYCNEFYNDVDGIHPLVSSDDIGCAIAQYLTYPRKHLTSGEVVFDSIDRENVRSIIEARIKIFEEISN
tara:strand:- start:537 stop:779 length:243 start_codon:yes stop_codon:yes gene_type:complete